MASRCRGAPVKGYEPLNALKPVAPDIWVVDGPQISFYGLPFPTRMTVVRLAGGDLWVHSPILYNQWLGRDISVHGEVRHLLSPNWIHYAGLPGWQSAFPEALTWASPGVRERAAKQGVAIRWDRALGPVAPPDWAGEIDQDLVESRWHSEVVFFHRASRTLILTDLIENFERARIPFWFRPLARLAGVLDPDGKAPVDMRSGFRGRRRRDLRTAVQRMISWGPERVILAHGRWYETGGVAELRRAFRWVL